MTLDRTMRLCVVKERTYQLAAINVKGKRDPAQVAKFFDSFRPLDGSGAATPSASGSAPAGPPASPP